MLSSRMRLTHNALACLQIIEGVNAALDDVRLDAEYGPQEVIQLMGGMLVAVEGKMGPLLQWPEVLVGSDATNHINTQQGGQGCTGAACDLFGL